MGATSSGISCTFCRIIKGNLPSWKVFEDDRTVAFLDINPLSKGHTLVVPKTHVSRVQEEEDSKYLFSAVRLLVGKVQAAMRAPACNVGINNGAESGQEVPYLHVHIIPRFNGDGGGSVLSVISKRPKISKGEMEKINRAIRETVGSKG